MNRMEQQTTTLHEVKSSTDMAIQLINIAASSIENARYEDAILTLRRAMHEIAEDDDVDEDDNDDDDDDTRQEDDEQDEHEDNIIQKQQEDYNSSLRDQDGKTTLSIDRYERFDYSNNYSSVTNTDVQHVVVDFKNLDQEEEEESVPFVYRKPIHVSTRTAIWYQRRRYQEREDYDDDTDNDICMRLYIHAMYNLALAHHLLALTIPIDTNRKQRNWYLSGALKLYELCYSLLATSLHNQQQQTNETNNEEEDDDVLTVTQSMGLVNNCAQIHMEFHREKKANRLYELLLSTLMLTIVENKDLSSSSTTITPPSTDTTTTTTLSSSSSEVPVDEIDGFISMTSHLIFKHPAAASAA